MQVESPEIKISSSSQNISIQFNLSVDGKLDRRNVKFKLKDNLFDTSNFCKFQKRKLCM